MITEMAIFGVGDVDVISGFAQDECLPRRSAISPHSIVKNVYGDGIVAGFFRT